MITPQTGPDPTPMSSLIQLEVDVPRRRAIMTMPPRASGGRITRALARLLSDDPALASWDWVIDLTANHEGATNADVDELLAAYLNCARTPGGKYTCVVLNDPYYFLWALALDQRFEDRTHKSFTTLTSATRFLDSAERQPPAR
jgi:hypothetical protein